ncbi:hypothetical protein ACOSP7_013771 [Xanthoceras sorbifolium]
MYHTIMPLLLLPLSSQQTMPPLPSSPPPLPPSSPRQIMPPLPSSPPPLPPSSPLQTISPLPSSPPASLSPPSEDQDLGNARPFTSSGLRDEVQAGLFCPCLWFVYVVVSSNDRYR